MEEVVIRVVKGSMAVKKSNKEIKVKPLLFDSYLAAVRNSVGTRMFRNFYARINRKKEDVTIDGIRSCAFFVSTILTMFGLTKSVHLTLAKVIKDMEESGWYKIKKPRVGAVLIWEREKMSGKWFGHVGFYVGGDMAISNSTSVRTPQRHHWTFDNKRGIKAIYWHRKLQEGK